MYNIENLIKLFSFNREYTLKNIQHLFDVDRETLLKDLHELELQGIITIKNNLYKKLDCNNFAVGNLKIYESCGVFMCNGIKYKICKEDFGCALNYDTCQFIINKSNKKAKVNKVLKRSKNNVICEISNNQVRILGTDKIIKLPSNQIKHLLEGTIVQVELDTTNLSGTIINILGNKTDPDIDLIEILAEYNFPIEFSKETTEEIKKIPSFVSENEIVNRVDLRDETTFTIDCDNTKDMDDAVSIKKLKNGNYLLGIHIADVAHYIKYNSPIYKDALKRGTSVYLLDSVVPMLPRELSNGICSLNPGVDRLTKSCFIEIDENGNIVNSKVVNSVINSKMKMKYSDVNKILENNETICSYEPFVEDLKLMNELNKLLTKVNNQRGFIKFLSNDLRIKLEDNKPVEFINPQPKTAESIIENFMLIANETIATNYCLMPFIFRIHEAPDEDTIKKSIEMLNTLGYKIPKIKNYTNSRCLQGLLKKLSSEKDFKIISNFILQSMKKAKYSIENTGHFALAYDYYTHFTAPIRRISDLTVQLIIDEYEKSNFHVGKNMEGHIGEFFEGKIINITPSGAIVETNNIIGIVNFKNITGDQFSFNPDTISIIGRKTKTIYKIGNMVTVKVINASKEFRTIDFKIEQKTLKKDKTLTLSR